MKILDTCILSETIKPRANKKLLFWLSEQKNEELYLTSFTIGEIKRGIEKLESSTKKHSLLLWLMKLLDVYSDRILDFDKETALVWANLYSEAEKTGSKPSLMDSLIAAISYQHKASLVTLNKKDFKNLNIRVIDL